MATYQYKRTASKIPQGLDNLQNIFKLNTRVFQFAKAIQSSASNIFHLFHRLYTNALSADPNEHYSTIIVPLDLHNTFNMKSRQHIPQHFASACPMMKTWCHSTDGISNGNKPSPLLHDCQFEKFYHSILKCFPQLAQTASSKLYSTSQ